MKINIAKLLILECIKKRARTASDLAFLKRKISKKYKIQHFSNIELLKAYRDLLENKEIKKNFILEDLFIKKKIRSLSGVVIISVLTKPYPCPGKCVFCPNEKGLPKSYLSGEPAVERAKQANFNPYIQTQSRLKSLEIQGHPIDKTELRIIGASFTAYPKKYQSLFVAKCFQAANDFSQYRHSEPRRRIPLSTLALEKEQKKNEKARCRIVGISIETRPDLINAKEILNLRKLGITMVELGVQTVFDDILKKCNRGHLTQATIKATQLLKNAGFKVMYQIMPNLPGANFKQDLESVKIIFSDENFKPDWLKIYPCLVCKGAKLYQIWKKGEYQSYSDKKLIELMVKIKQVLPYWVRVARLFRDIPSQKIESGSKVSNLRQVVQKEMEKQGKQCHCIRCREVKEKYDAKEKIFLFREDYDASGGKEIFLSFENKNRNKLYSLLRLRIKKDGGIVRELHTFGQMIPISKKSLSVQHKGLGKKLIKQAEKITKKEFHLNKIAIISGVGAREYYRKLGYKLKDTYMLKKF